MSHEGKEMGKKSVLTIAADSDGCLADLVHKMLQICNQEHGTAFTHEDITDFNFKTCIPQYADYFFSLFERPGFFRDLPLLPDAQAVIRQLIADGHFVEIATAPPSTKRNGVKIISPEAAFDKVLWFADHFPEIENRVTLTTCKHLLKVDLLIDDHHTNIERFCAHHPEGLGFLVNQPWNRNLLLPSNAKRGELRDLPKTVEKLVKLKELMGGN
jgi:5'(3')-deoxyribonucleotidase